MAAEKCIAEGTELTLLRVVSLDNSTVLPQSDKLSKGLLAAPPATKPVYVEAYPFLSLLFEPYALVENLKGSPLR